MWIISSQIVPLSQIEEIDTADVLIFSSEKSKLKIATRINIKENYRPKAVFPFMQIRSETDPYPIWVSTLIRSVTDADALKLYVINVYW